MDKTLSAWYLKNARDLPWRKSQDPYRIWVSEIMLQQTQVQTVIPYYERFLKSFPTLDSLAATPLETVLTHWSGLGYYSRARNLHKGASFITQNLRGQFPVTRESILEVPGIGPYTAGAILSIAFDLAVPLVDGNVQRVFSRFFGFQKPIDTKEAQDFFWQKAGELITQAKSPRVFNQALMELGATVCTKASPLCEACPLSQQCEAKRLGITADIPFKKKKLQYKDVYWLSLVIENNGRYLLRKNQKGEWWRDLWNFPHWEVKSPNEARDKAIGLKENWRAGSALELNHQKHTVTHHRLHIIPYLIRLKKGAKPVDGAWVSTADIPHFPLSSLAKKILAANSNVGTAHKGYSKIPV